MEKKGKIILISTIICVVFLSTLFILSQLDNKEEEDTSYDPLKNMDVIYLSADNITGWAEGYSVSSDCPWGFEHRGLDFSFVNHSKVIAAADGEVREIIINEWDPPNQYHVVIWIDFNEGIFLGYTFEPWTDDIDRANEQLDMFTVKEGDHVKKGEIIAEFLAVGGGAHIDFGVIEDNERQCPKKYFSDEGYEKIMNLIHTYHSDWELCYH